MVEAVSCDCQECGNDTDADEAIPGLRQVEIASPARYAGRLAMTVNGGFDIFMIVR